MEAERGGKIIMYTRYERVYVSFDFNQKVLATVMNMTKPFYYPRIKEWSFSILSLNDFLQQHECHVLDHEMIIYKGEKESCFKFLENQDLSDLADKVQEVSYDGQNLVFIIPNSSYEQLCDYATEKGFTPFIKFIKHSIPYQMNQKKKYSKFSAGDNSIYMPSVEYVKKSNFEPNISFSQVQNILNNRKRPRDM